MSTTRTPPIRRHRLWWRWVAANAVGEGVGLGGVAALAAWAFTAFGEPQGAPQVLAFAAGLVALGAFEGAVVGVAQRRVLRTVWPSLQGWVRASVAGGVVAWAVGMVPSTVAQLVVGASGVPGGAGAAAAPAEPPLAVVLLLAAALGAVAGPILAAFQWRVLRRVAPLGAWRWLPAHAVAWAVGMPIVFLAAQADLGAAPPALRVAAAAACLFAAGAAVGAVHGLALLSLLPERSRAAPPTPSRGP